MSRADALAVARVGVLLTAIRRDVARVATLSAEIDGSFWVPQHKEAKRLRALLRIAERMAELDTALSSGQPLPSDWTRREAV